MPFTAPEISQRQCYLRFAAPPVKCPTDIVFVVDESGSIGSSNFNRVKSFLLHLLSRMDIDNCKTRVAVVTFATNIGGGFNLSYCSCNSSDCKSAISRLIYSGGGTNTAVALAHVRKRMLTLTAGDRGNVPNVVVVITDGQSANKSATRVSCHYYGIVYVFKSRFLVSVVQDSFKKHSGDTRCSLDTSKTYSKDKSCKIVSSKYFSKILIGRYFCIF